MPPSFIYFDLGNVLLNFSHDKMCEQLAEVLNTDKPKVQSFLFGDDDDFNLKFEAGEYSSDEFYQRMCDEFKATPDQEEFNNAASDIFQANVAMFPVLFHLAASGHKLGLLSNINETHWNWILERGYGLIPDVFDVLCLSYEAKAVKPDAKIFQHAAELAGVAPNEIFYTDDIAGHIEGAKAAGFDAVQFQNPMQLQDEMRKREIVSNY